MHLSEDIETAQDVAYRRKGDVPKILIINSKLMYNDGYNFYLSDNHVWLTKHVKPVYITIKE